MIILNFANRVQLFDFLDVPTGISNTYHSVRGRLTIFGFQTAVLQVVCYGIGIDYIAVGVCKSELFIGVKLIVVDRTLLKV